MPYQHDKINKLEGGWYVVYEDGKVIIETDMPWVKVPKKREIKIMGLKWRNKHFELKNKENYIPPGETHIRELAVSSNDQIQMTKQSIVGRFIGYYDQECKVVTRVDISSGKFITEEVPYR